MFLFMEGLDTEGSAKAFGCYRRDKEQMSNEMTDSPLRDMRCSVCALSSAAFTSQNMAEQLPDMFLIVASFPSCTSAAETVRLLSPMSNNMEVLLLPHKDICMSRPRPCQLKEFTAKKETYKSKFTAQSHYSANVSIHSLWTLMLF